MEIGMETESLKADLERITGARTVGGGEKMSTLLARLDAIAREEETPERLKHYLSKRSYVKALAWLDDPSTPHQL